MMDDGLEHDFDAELAVKAIRKAIKDTFDGQKCVDVERKNMDKWSKSISESILKQCQDNCNCKYAVTLVIGQKVGAGFTAHNKMLWDCNHVEDGGDTFVKVSWENETIHVLVTLYAIKVMAYFSQEQVRALKAMDFDAGL
ncbi:Dynein light chain Tctex-type 1 [Hondaea fermentalgiana]|uniref:Dynein light chain Tctex-type 1 n=1 Tax=Hondaea fermentalgiana TaxID=2315210 RepID=A0A2R5GL11_9STRA|nr:Dynein light chain Tctex-type 1 [Hondaea fermentalgiana]|eukprot:GBG31325.1 Dynein light chain Tctex-type 1 [Hondaea fermentalgiana]